MKRTYEGTKTVWCDIKKGRRALDRARRLHRLAEFLSDIEDARTDGTEVEITKRMQSGVLFAGQNRLAFATSIGVQFTRWGGQRYTDEQRAEALGYANV